MTQIALLDYGMGNLHSAAKALEHVGATVDVTNDPKLIAQADKIVFPGVGAMRDCMQGMHEAGIDEVVRKAAFNKPVLANIDDNDVWRVGFITQEEAVDFGFTGYVAVYIPMSYSISGNVYLIWTVLFSGDDYGYVNSLLLKLGGKVSPEQFDDGSDDAALAA